MAAINYLTPKTIAIGLGANIASPVGTPTSTLITARPLLEKIIKNWINAFLNEKAEEGSSFNSRLKFNWSPLYETKPLGGPPKQPNYINAVLVVRGGDLSNINPSKNAAIDLLDRLCKIEKQFGRNRNSKTIKWGPRSLDIDFLAWGGLQVNSSNLILPHPHLIERDFVLIPLAEAIKKNSEPLIRINPQEGWEE